VRGNSYEKFRAFAKVIDEQSENLLTIRGLFKIKGAEEDGRAAVPIEEVEPAKEIVRRFATGAMSFGSISREAHTTLAIAMNRIGGRSKPGKAARRPTVQAAAERRFHALGDQAGGVGPFRGDHRVSGQLRHDADQDGAGRQARRGGQLPGHKVDEIIAKVRHSTPGVGLISPRRTTTSIRSRTWRSSSSTSRTSIPRAWCR